MNVRRAAVVGLVVVAGLGLTACKSDTTPGGTSAPTTTATPQLGPAQQLLAAFGKLKTQGYDVAVTQQGSDLTAKASVDPARNAATEAVQVGPVGQGFSVTAVQVDTKLWFKLDFGATLNARGGFDPKKWMLFEPSKLKADKRPFDLTGTDALALSGLFGSVANVTRTDATHLAGTVDLTKATGPNTFSAEDLAAAGAAAATAPFTVALDDQGRLVELKITSDAGGGVLATDILVSNYGSPSPITAPADADVIPTPDVAYQFLNGE